GAHRTRCAPDRAPILADRLEAACRTAFACLVRLPSGTRLTGGFPMQAMEATTVSTKVIYGVNELDLDLAGKSIRGIWKVLEQVLNIPREAAVSVNGSRVEDDYV